MTKLACAFTVITGKVVVQIIFDCMAYSRFHTAAQDDELKRLRRKNAINTRGDQTERGPVPVSDYCYKNQLGMFTAFQSNIVCILCTYSFLIPLHETRARARHVTLL